MRPISFFIIAVVLMCLLGVAVVSFLLPSKGTSPDFTAMAKEGVPIAEAIYRFKNDNGLWPQYAEDLIPKYLAEFPEEEWKYDHACLDREVTYNRGLFTSYGIVRYNFRDDKPRWKVVSRESEQNLTVTQSIPTPSLSKEEVAKNKMAELEKRVKREPGEIKHHRWLVSYLRSIGQHDKALAACERSRQALPKHWWPRLAKVLLLRQGEAQAAGDLEFAKWVGESPSFTHYYYLWHLRQRRGRHAEALQAIQKALEHPLKTTDDDTFIPAYYAIETAIYAYRKRKFELGISLCDRIGSLSYGERSHFAVRAACYLALGKTEEAGKEVEKALEKRNTWAGNAEALKEAIEKGDTEFVYDPGIPSWFRVFARPENIE